MVLEIAAAVVALAFAVLVGFLVPTLIQLRKTIKESRQLVAHLDAEVPVLVRQVRAVTEHVGAMTGQARDGMEHASALLHAVGEVGESVQQVHKAMRTKSGALLVKLASMMAGVRAVSTVVKGRVHRGAGEHSHAEGGDDDGKR